MNPRPPAARPWPKCPLHRGGNYETISTAEALSSWVAQAVSARRVALHVQTDGNPRPWQAAFLGVALAVDAGRAAYWPRPSGELTEPRLSLDDAAPELARLLADPSVLKIVPNAKHAGLVLRQAGLPAAEPGQRSHAGGLRADCGRA